MGEEEAAFAGLPEDLDGFAAEWFPTTAAGPRRRGLRRLLSTGATACDVAEYLSALRDAVRCDFQNVHVAFKGLGSAQHPFGAACTLERFELWREHRRKREASRERDRRSSAPRARSVTLPEGGLEAALERAREKTSRA